MLLPGSAGVRGSVVMRLRPCVAMSAEPGLADENPPLRRADEYRTPQPRYVTKYSRTVGFAYQGKVECIGHMTCYDLYDLSLLDDLDLSGPTGISLICTI